MAFEPSENPITNPTRESYTELRPFRFWCQKVLPLVYDDSLSYYELLCKVVDYLNKTMEDVDHMNTDMDTLYSNFQEFQEGTIRIYNELVAYVNTYFDELDVQKEIDNKLDEMVTSGELVTILQPSIADEVASWLSEHITPTSPAIDASLTVQGAGADAKVTGDMIRDLTSKSLSVKGYLSANENFNDYQTTGIYLLNMTTADYATLSNAPSLDLIESPVGWFLEVTHSTTIPNRGVLLQRLIGKNPNFSNKYSCVARYGIQNNDGMVFQPWSVESYSKTGIDNNMAYISGGAIPFVMESRVSFPYKANVGELFSFVISRANFDTTGLTNLYFEGWLNGNYVATIGLINRPSNKDVGKIFTYTINNEIDELVLTSNKAPNAVINAFYGAVRLQPAYVANEVSKISRVFRVGAGQEYQSILACVIEAEKYKNSIVYIDSGTYDIVQEFKDYYGSDYFTKTNYYGQDNYRGIPLCNGIHIIGLGDVILTGGLSSDVNQSALNWWSIFNAGDDTNGTDGYGFILENLTVKVLNEYIRYAIHDEHGNSDDSYTNKYIKCHFILPDTLNKRCIGGGLGKHGYIVIDNCTIKANGYSSTDRGINYHNNEDSDSISKIYVNNCYIPNGTVGITWYGQTSADEKSIMYVNNCYLQHEPIKQAETAGSTIENVDVVSWCNTIAQ